jgi:hypothetical protein
VSDGVPATRAIVWSVAVPELPSVSVPSSVVPLKNWTLPVGIPIPVLATTVAVSVTCCPLTGLVGAAMSVVVDA